MQELPVTLHLKPDRTMFAKTVHCPWTHRPESVRGCSRCRDYLGRLKDPKRGEFVRCNWAQEGGDAP